MDIHTYGNTFYSNTTEVSEEPLPVDRRFFLAKIKKDSFPLPGEINFWGDKIWLFFFKTLDLQVYLKKLQTTEFAWHYLERPPSSSTDLGLEDSVTRCKIIGWSRSGNTCLQTGNFDW